ncbi:acylneuraminate cytidylyltransferase family protein [Meridianimarinicoccus aquatilis]|uniref:Acylneuraminate cytidylyltransferase family protein n=1 Tax=Meridianimarinicoccus aquatilis TaxID=2552766 RepID=A0A4R6AWJ7_9RHOB|nr:acylneuraminate cytidylyltransferase family protein [Fluviibacterium aquatile]QIE43652.1 acylneuraminate cytidylyltransferase family protein [Rhodobacteraceae bacterium SC52]TDL88142.1 acylneuraminate cytidylyltransferase family protein [Fluviibacterium aquatile]
MIAGKRVLTLVPARSGSKGLPNKNIRPLLGKPLLAWPIEAALASRHVDRVVLSTDSEEYAEIGRAHGADVPFLRPAKLASDTAPSIDAIEHAIVTLAETGDEYDILVLLEPTSPMTEGADIDAALQALVAQPGMTAAVGVSAMETQHPAFAVRRDPATGRIGPLMGDDFGALPRRQDLEPVYALDGSFYLSTIEAIRAKRGFCHDATIGIPTARYKALEVDDLVDFLCIEAIMKFRAKNAVSEGENR